MNKEEIVEKTWLAPREAEVYILKEDEGMTLREIAEEFGTSFGSVSSQWNSIKEKVRKSERTAEILGL